MPDGLILYLQVAFQTIIDIFFRPTTVRAKKHKRRGSLIFSFMVYAQEILNHIQQRVVFL